MRRIKMQERSTEAGSFPSDPLGSSMTSVKAERLGRRHSTAHSRPLQTAARPRDIGFGGSRAVTGG
jgi:hypothetical protein